MHLWKTYTNCFFYFTLLIFQTQDVFTQNNRAKEIGLNVNGVISSIFNGNPVLSDPHTLVFKWEGNENVFSRIGLGVNIFTNSTTSGFLINNKYTIYFKIGREKRKELFKNFYWTYGIDILSEGEFERTKATFSSSQGSVSTLTNGFGVGIAPFIGFNYRPHPKVSITTESPLNIIFRRSKSETVQNNPFINETLINDNFRVQHSLPGVIYLFINF